MRRFRKLLLVALAAVALAAHVSYWYGARPRSAVPGGLPARLLAAGAYDACFWAPYPHQNVGSLRGRVEDGAAWLDAVARVANLPPPVLPSFGPFAVPPASEVAACSDLSGDRFVVVAQVYPSIAAVARLAGRVAGNPWLAGGEARELREGAAAVTEREIKVAWQGGAWVVSAGSLPDLSATPAPAHAWPESFGIFRLNKDVADFPTGDYLLERREGDLELILAGGAVPPDLPADVRLVLLGVAGPSWPPAEPRPLPPAALALFDIGEEGPLGSSLPGIAVFHPPGSRRWEMPAQGLAGLLTGRLPQGNAAGWRIVAVDDASLGRAVALAPRLAALTPPDAAGTPAQGGRLVLGIWVEPTPARRLIARVRRFFEKVPLVEPRQVERWKDWETLLRPLSNCDRVALAATRSPDAFRLRFHACAASAGEGRRRSSGRSSD